MTNKICVKTPATTANMGPGFDCLGMALDIWNTLIVTDGDGKVVVSGKGSDELPHDGNNLVCRSFNKFFIDAGLPVPSVDFDCNNVIPLARGMGSSSAALVSGLLAANKYSGDILNKQELLKIAADMEGHLDNAAAAINGGLLISVYDNEDVVTASVPIPEEISIVIYVPDVPMPTDKSRGVLNPTLAREDAVYNIGRSALLVNCMATGNLENLKVATQDRLHQPDRQQIFFPMKNIIQAAINSGALGAYLSGAGSSILALCVDREYTIGYEMADAAMKSGLNGEIIVTKPSLSGAYFK